MMSCAAHHCVAVRDGLAVAFASGNGGNRFGQLGRGTATSSSNRRNDDESSGSRQPMSMTLPADAEGLTVVAAAAAPPGASELKPAKKPLSQARCASSKGALSGIKGTSDIILAVKYFKQ